MSPDIFEQLGVKRVRIPDHPASSPILRADNLTVTFGSTTVLDRMSFVVQHGDVIAVIGPNGAGKSTLFQVIAGLLEPSSGILHVYGSDPRGHICIGYVPQRTQVDWQFPVNVRDVVMMGRAGRLGLLRFPGKKDHEIVQSALETVGMQQLADRRINQLSGGQQQRVFIARALVQEAELILLDEPLNGLDLQSQEGLFRLIENLALRNVTMMISLHDINLAKERFSKAMLLQQELVAFDHPDRVFTTENLSRAYGSKLHLVNDGNGWMAVSDTCCDGHDDHEHPSGDQ